jgi:hypothetical protein
MARLGALAVLALSAGCSAPATIEAQSFVLVDASGRKRAELGMLYQVQRTLEATSRGARPSSDLPGLVTVEPGLVIFDAEGKSRAVLSLSHGDGTPALVLLSDKGNPTAVVGHGLDGRPCLALYDPVTGRLARLVAAEQPEHR